MCSPSYVTTGYAERLSVLATWLRAMQRGLVCPQVDLCVGKFRDVIGGTKSLRASWAYPQRLSHVGNG